jgi:hypothetical protein
MGLKIHDLPLVDEGFKGFSAQFMVYSTADNCATMLEILNCV